ITPAEEEMLKVLKEKFEKVIVLLNTTNVMHTGFLEELNIDAALYVGITGQSAAMAIPRLLTGEVTPSGKVADTYAYSTEYDPTFRNIATGSNQYVEDIYYGYKWYETADYEGYFADVSNEYGEGYDGVVQYPFGFGKSYTDFTWSLSSLTVTDAAGKEEALDYTETINLNDYKVTDKFTLTVNVTNVGEYVGKDVVQLYSTPEYFRGEVEKAHVNLLDFAKTAQIGTTAGVDNVGSVKVSFTPYDLASYDAYDKNDNGASTYELDEGSYEIKLMTDAHNLADMENAVIKFEATSDIIINEDPITNVEVKNRLTGDTAYAGLPIDGSTVGADGYMTRANFLGTFPTKQAKKPSGTAMNTANRFMNDAPYEALPDPVYGEDNGLYIATLSDGSQANIDQLNRKSSAFEEGVTLVWNEELVAELAADYNGEKWEQLLNQLNKNEIEKLIEQGGFRRNATLSVGLPIMSDRDGPAGFNVAGLTGDWSGDRTTNTKWTAFPSEALMGCSWNKDLMFELGRSMGAEAAETSVNGWYAPGVNLHRSQYLGRNFEYYSEDGVISGKLAAMVIYGAKTNGLTCFLKHFVCSDAGQNPNGYDTWLTEQTLRENALKPFEIAVKEGGSNGIMSAFNDIGTVWSGANYALLTQILRNEWGFEGTVLTDWTPATGASIGGMNVQQGIRAGNDIWLNTGNSYSGGMETSNKIDMKAARIAVHNILFTVVDTQQTAIEYRDMDIEDIYQTSGTIGFVEEVFPWWIPALIAIDVAAVAGLGFWAFTLVKPKKQVA
ncbi:MAG: glycoside hydrolase family 3 C-terminal domain-containing protein, partial [Clostridia bacterium]|nr:glycoside hydrolase family 3 C-terminal domain-containing protein [Clostridia bacterium]